MRECGLQDGVVRRCWREAKITSQPPLDQMNKAEWMKACRLAVNAGGKPLDMKIAAKLTELGNVDEHSGSDEELSSDGEVPPPSKPRLRASTRDSDDVNDADGAMARELLDGHSDSDSSDPESESHQRRLLRMHRRSRSGTTATNSIRVPPQRAASASPPKQPAAAPANIRRF